MTGTESLRSPGSGVQLALTSSSLPTGLRARSASRKKACGAGCLLGRSAPPHRDSDAAKIHCLRWGAGKHPAETSMAEWESAPTRLKSEIAAMVSKRRPCGIGSSSLTAVGQKTVKEEHKLLYSFPVVLTGHLFVGYF